MRERLERALGPILGALAMGLILLLAVAVVAVPGGLVMRLFGFRYDSVGAVLLYFLLVTLLSIPFDGLAKALPRVLAGTGRIGARAGWALYAALDFTFSCLELAAADYLMGSVAATPASIAVASALLLLVSLLGARKKQEK